MRIWRRCPLWMDKLEKGCFLHLPVCGLSLKATLHCPDNDPGTFLSCQPGLVSLPREGARGTLEEEEAALCGPGACFFWMCPHGYLPQLSKGSSALAAPQQTSRPFSGPIMSRAAESESVLVSRGLLGSFFTWVLCLNPRGSGWS